MVRKVQGQGQILAEVGMYVTVKVDNSVIVSNHRVKCIQLLVYFDFSHTHPGIVYIYRVACIQLTIIYFYCSV